MSNKTYDRLLERQYYHEEYCCCDCGFVRGCGHHPLIRCPITGRCGECGNDWPCEDHAHLLSEEQQKKANRPSYLKKS